MADQTSHFQVTLNGIMLYMCSDHFKAHDWLESESVSRGPIKSKIKTRKLLPNAVPSMNLTVIETDNVPVKKPKASKSYSKPKSKFQ